MKRIILALLVSFFSINTFAAELYTLDPFHSYVNWQISHFGYSHPSGKWMAEGTISIDEKHPTKSKANVSIDIAKIITGIPELDKHLLSSDFFEVAKFPIATFVSNKIVITSKRTGKIFGTLTIRNISKPVVLYATFNKRGLSEMTKHPTIGFSATASVNRSDFGMTNYLPGLGNKVNLMIEVEANQ